MSKSRLEKFLYALYSLDHSDLPTPLSRIEELYKCWVTGEEAPTFEPLSRVEKYLMAILGVYDVSELPNPISRVEVLLHKLAIGDDNLDDIESFLSEHEELLAEIIRNGGAGGNINIEYVLYTLSTEHNTLYNTAEKPVKSAILNGMTLVNLLPNKGKQHVSVSGNRIVKYPLSHTLKKNTKYLVYYNVEDISNPSGTNSLQISMYSEDTSIVDLIDSIDKAGLRKYIFTTSDKDFEQPSVWFFVFKGETTEVIFDEVMILEYQDGMENWDIPYFEGMQSVKMPVLTMSDTELSTIPISFFEENNFTNVSGWTNFKLPQTFNDATIKCKVYGLNELRLNYNRSVTITNNDLKNGIKIKVDNLTDIGFNGNGIGNNNEGNLIMWLKDGTIELEINGYKKSSYKSNILTVNEEVELHKIGDIKDELDLITGDVIRKLGKITLNGSEIWGDSDNKLPNTSRFYTPVPIFKTSAILLNDGGFDNITSGTSSIDTEHIQASGGSLFVRISRNRVDSLEDLKSFLSSNPLTIIGELAAGTLSETVDLSVVNQDGNDTKLSTFNDLTHVTLSSEGLICEAELEVATKNKEVLNTMSLEMDDICTTQTTLEETSNTQSENVDATMIATTEIYEELL